MQLLPLISKFSTKPSALHYYYLKGIAKCLRLTKDKDGVLSIKFKRTAERDELDLYLARSFRAQNPVYFFRLME